MSHEEGRSRRRRRVTSECPDGIDPVTAAAAAATAAAIAATAATTAATAAADAEVELQRTASVLLNGISYAGNIKLMSPSRH